MCAPPNPMLAVIVRTYEYESERVCDSRMSVFLKSIEAAHSAEGQGFAGGCGPCVAAAC